MTFYITMIYKLLIQSILQLTRHHYNYILTLVVEILRANFVGTHPFVLVAQLVEHKAENLGVAGSSPVQNTFAIYFKTLL